MHKVASLTGSLLGVEVPWAFWVVVVVEGKKRENVGTSCRARVWIGKGEGDCGSGWMDGYLH